MSEKAWAWVHWWSGFLMLILLAVPTLGFTIPFVAGWWIAGPFYVSNDGEVAPFWKPMKPQRLWWRDVR